jgi:hypothetical protein
MLMSTRFAKSEPVQFPVYLMRGETVELDGKTYVIPEPVACQNAQELAVFLYEHHVTPINERAPVRAARAAALGYAG